MLDPDRLAGGRKFVNTVERCHWGAVCFTADSEHVVAGTSGEHNMYVWNAFSGAMDRILEGESDTAAAEQGVASAAFEGRRGFEHSMGMMRFTARRSRGVAVA